MNPSTVILAATPDDAAGIAAVQRLAWIATYPNPAIGITEADIRARMDGDQFARREARWRTIITEGKRPMFVAKEGDTVIGMVAPRYDEDRDQQRLGALYVLPEAQGQGLGRQLLSTALASLDRSKDVYLHVIAYNERAIRFYQRNGFVLTGRPIPPGVSPLPSGVHLPELEMVLTPKVQ